jgi:hypothetical protein
MGKFSNVYKTKKSHSKVVVWAYGIDMSVTSGYWAAWVTFQEASFFVSNKGPKKDDYMYEFEEVFRMHIYQIFV